MVKPICFRREFVVTAGTLAVGVGLLRRQAVADLPAMQAWKDAIIGGRDVQDGRIALKMPEIAENGNNVALTVEVDSPMTDDHHVVAVHIMTERNPDPEVATFHLSPRNGKAKISTRIRLAESGRVHAVAELSSGSVFTTVKDVKVTIGGCGG